MALYALLLTFIFSMASSLLSEKPSSGVIQPEIGRAFFLIQSGNHNEALRIYEELYKQTGRHDFDLLQKIGLAILEHGCRSREPEVQLLTLFGAGIAFDDKVLYIMEEGLRSKHPQLQLAALNLLAQNLSDKADEILVRALGSEYLQIRLEACFILAKKKHPSAIVQAESLMYKLPQGAQVVFPRLFASCGTAPANRLLRKLFAHPLEAVKIEAIIAAAELGRDDLLPRIRRLATHLSHPQQEACAYAFKILHDETAIPKLVALTACNTSSVVIAANLALHHLGRLEAAWPIQQLAMQEDLFAIAALKDIQGSEECLQYLTKSSNPAVRINASLSLLNLREPSCLSGLAEIFVKDARDFAFSKTFSAGSSLSAWKVIPSASQNLSERPADLELSVSMREETLALAANNLEEKHFLLLADYIFEAQQYDLVPALVKLLEEIATPEAIALLQQHQQKLGAPLIRHYCNLALYRLNIPGPYVDNLRLWAQENCYADLINFRPLLPKEQRRRQTPYHLTPKETSRLLIEAMEAFASHRDEAGIEVLVDAIHYGNPKNRYALAGLLVRATQ